MGLVVITTNKAGNELVLYGGRVGITSNGFVNVVSKFTTPRILAKRIGDNISRVNLIGGCIVSRCNRK